MCYPSFCQKFEAEENGIISDRIDQEIIPSFFKVKVEGLPDQINDTFGLEKVCLHIKHRRPVDLKIELLSPYGTNVWLSNRNGINNDYGYLNTCFKQNGFNGETYRPERFFEGEYIPEGRLEFFNNGQNPNGIWLIVITDLDNGEVGKLEEVSITFSDNPARRNQSNCTKENPQNCACSNELGKLLPDLIISEKLTTSNIQYFDKNDIQYPNQIRFAAAMANIGEGPLEIITTNNWYCNDEIVESHVNCTDGSSPTNNVQQIVYQIKKGEMIYDTLKSGTMFFDDSPGHNHYHVKNWANFKVIKKRWWTNNPKKWKVIASSNKISYCLFDNKICSEENEYCTFDDEIYSDKNLTNYGLGKYVSCNSKIQGISVGGIDYYGAFYEGQSIDIPENIKSGTYYLLIEVDPLNEYVEMDEGNNTFMMKFEIP